jgi:cold shock CspA family protein
MPVVYHGGGRRPVARAGFQSGIALRWNAERGFGFIKPDQGDEDVFCHVSAIKGGNRLRDGASCEFKIEYDDCRGKHHAAEVSGEAVTTDHARGCGAPMMATPAYQSFQLRPIAPLLYAYPPGAQSFHLIVTEPHGSAAVQALCGRSERIISQDVRISPDIMLYTGAVIRLDSSDGQAQTSTTGQRWRTSTLTPLDERRMSRMGPGGYPGYEDPKEREIYRFYALGNDYQLRRLGTSMQELNQWEDLCSRVYPYEPPYADLDA